VSEQLKKRGNWLGFAFFHLLVRVTGLRGAYGFLNFVALHYLLFDRDATERAGAYIKRRFPNCSKWKTYYHIHRLFVTQGKQLIDRYAMLANPDLFDFKLHIVDESVRELLQESGKGMILLTSHVGNWQLGMGRLSDVEKKVFLLMRKEDNDALQKSLHLNPGQDVGFISVDTFLGGVVEMMDVIKSGNIVSIMGDRSYGAKTVPVEFLGETAYFPYTAFHIATASKCPVFVLFAVKESHKCYGVHLEVMHPVIKRGKGNKVDKLQPFVQEFVGKIERFIEQYPYQCFLFYDVWKKENVDE
jgi:predicted LPLAT superfamily acyltransferase